MRREPFKSFKQLSAAAESGDPAAQEKLALSYLEGFGVKRDYGEARRWYESAANQNDPGGHFGLAVMNAMGFGCRQDFKQAYVHLLLMRRRIDALKKRWSEDTVRRMMATSENIEQNLSESERKQATQSADRWPSNR